MVFNTYYVIVPKYLQKVNRPSGHTEDKFTMLIVFGLLTEVFTLGKIRIKR